MKISNAIKNYSVYLVAIISLLILPYSAQAAVDMFLQLEGINGESRDKDYQGSIDVIGFSEGLSVVTSVNTGGGSSGSRPSLQDINVTKYLDRSSPVIRQMLAEGRPIARAMLTVRRAGALPLVFFQIDMTNVILTSVSTGASAGVDRLTENITLNFATIQWTYTPQLPDGSADANVTRGWDVVNNIPR